MSIILCTDSLLMDLLNTTSCIITHLVGVFFILWLVMEQFFNKDILDLVIFSENLNSISEKPMFIEVFLYAFTFGIATSIFYSILSSKQVKFIEIFLLVISSLITYKRYKEKSINDMLVGLLSIPTIFIILIVFKKFGMDIKIESNLAYNLLFIVVLILMLYFFRSELLLREKIKLYVYTLGFTSIFLLFNNFLFENHIDFFILNKNGIYYGIFILVFGFYLINTKDRSFINNIFFPTLAGGIASIFIPYILNFLIQKVLA